MVCDFTGADEGLVQKLLNISWNEMGTSHSPNREQGYRYYHGKRASKLACEIARNEHLCEKINCISLIAASLFHDIGKCMPENDYDDHAKRGSIAVGKLLSGLFCRDSHKVVTEAIYWHNKRDESPDTLCVEGLILQDADILDHFGAQAVWLTIFNTAVDNNSVDEALKLWDSDQMNSWTDYAAGHLNFPTSQAAMQKRLDRTEQFFRHLRRENAGHLF